jgi:hypothetical protein
MAAMKSIFTQFGDADEGIQEAQLRALHETLGEPITDSQTEEVFASLGKERTAKLTFEDFLRWCAGSLPAPTQPPDSLVPRCSRFTHLSAHGSARRCRWSIDHAPDANGKRRGARYGSKFKVGVSFGGCCQTLTLVQHPLTR